MGASWVQFGFDSVSKNNLDVHSHDFLIRLDRLVAHLHGQPKGNVRLFKGEGGFV